MLSLASQARRLPLGRLIRRGTGRLRWVGRERPLVPPLVARAQDKGAIELGGAAAPSIRRLRMDLPSNGRNASTSSSRSILTSVVAPQGDAVVRSVGGFRADNLRLASPEWAPVPVHGNLGVSRPHHDVGGKRPGGVEGPQSIATTRARTSGSHATLTQLVTVPGLSEQLTRPRMPGSVPMPVYRRVALAGRSEADDPTVVGPSRRSYVPGGSPGVRSRGQRPGSETSVLALGDRQHRTSPHASLGDSGVKHGTIYLDGSALGQWVSDHLEQVMVRPARGPSGIDPRIMPVWGPLSAGV